MDKSVAVVTGGGRGIGLAFARRLTAAGHTVLITDIDEQAARGAAGQIGCTWIRHDVRDVDSHRVVADRAAELGSVRLWINNAGVLIAGESWSHDPSDIARSFDVNVGGVIAGSHAAVSAMTAEGGSILNIASTAALAPVPGLAIYAATKAAVLSFTTSLQGDLDHAGLRIRARALCPDVTATDMVGDVATDPGASILFAGRRPASAEDVARAGLALVESHQLMRTFPRANGAMARATGVFPVIGLRMSASAREAGARHQRQNVGH